MAKAEFLIHRDQFQNSSSLVLQTPDPTYGSERPHNAPCADCPIKNTAIADGCTTLAYNSYTKDVRATMRTPLESKCAIIGDPDNDSRVGNEDYDSLMAAYEDKKTAFDTIKKVKKALRDLGLIPDPEQLVFTPQQTI